MGKLKINQKKNVFVYVQNLPISTLISLIRSLVFFICFCEIFAPSGNSNVKLFYLEHTVGQQKNHWQIKRMHAPRLYFEIIYLLPSKMKENKNKQIEHKQRVLWFCWVELHTIYLDERATNSKNLTSKSKLYFIRFICGCVCMEM